MHNFLFIFFITLSFAHFTNFASLDSQNDRNNILQTNHNLKALSINEKNIDNFDSKKINKIFSEKFIQNNEIKIIVKKPLEKNLIIKNTKLLESLQYVKLNWKKEFTDKKSEFIETLLPLIAFENQKIIYERARLAAIKKYLISKKTLPDNDIKYLNNISKKYKIISINKHKIDLIDELLVKANIIPNAIVLAQAANESGWGTSRFAKDYNAFFGQYTYDEKNGVVPSNREKGKKHLIKNFISIDKSVESYFININTHYAYKKFRIIRSQLNSKDMKYNINLLTKALDVYAEDELYVKTINSIIESNNLNQFDINLQSFMDS